MGTNDSRFDRWTFAAAGLITGLALAVRLPAALSFALWQDEVASARILSSPGFGFLRHVAGTESTPPAWYTLAWVTHKLGVPVEDVRLLSVLFGSVLAGLLVLYARSLLPLSSAVLAGILAALGWQFVTHGSELRAYALFALVSMIFVILFEAAVQSPTRERLLGLAGCVALGSLTHYFFLFTLASGLVWLLISAEGRSARRPLMIACGVGLIPLVVWTPAFVAQYAHGKFSYIGPFDAIDVVYLYGRLFFHSLPSAGGGAAIALALVALTLFGSMRLWRQSPRGGLCALSAVLPAVLAALFWAAGLPVFAPRNLLSIAPFAAVAIAAGLAGLPRRIVPLAAVAGIVAMSAAYLDASPTRAEYDRVAQALVEEGWQARDPILIFGPLYDYFHPLDWYLFSGRELAVAAPRTGHRCTTVYVVSARYRGRDLALSSPSPPRRVQSVLVARLPWTDSIWTELRRRGGHVVASRSDLPPCVRLPR
jgi:hypothetical protein